MKPLVSGVTPVDPCAEQPVISKPGGTGELSTVPMADRRPANPLVFQRPGSLAPCLYHGLGFCAGCSWERPRAFRNHSSHHSRLTKYSEPGLTTTPKRKDFIYANKAACTFINRTFHFSSELQWSAKISYINNWSRWFYTPVYICSVPVFAFSKIPIVHSDNPACPLSQREIKAELAA